MTDLEITRLCAEAMGIDFGPELVAYTVGQQMNNEQIMANRIAAYDPLHDDAQAMALVKKFGLELKRVMQTWHVWTQAEDGCVLSKDLNRAICECVAKMRAALGGGK